MACRTAVGATSLACELSSAQNSNLFTRSSFHHSGVYRLLARSVLVLHIWTAVIFSIGARLVDHLGFFVRGIVPSLMRANDPKSQTRDRAKLLAI